MHIFDLNRKTYPTDGIKTVEHVEQNPIDCLQDNFKIPCVFFILPSEIFDYQKIVGNCRQKNRNDSFCNLVKC